MLETRLHAQPKTAPPTSLTPVRGGLLQRKCACGGSAGLAGDCEGCNKQDLSLQRSTRNSEPETRNSGGVPPIVNEVLRSRGQPLDAQTRAFMEPRFGHDFSKVRVHTDDSAAQSARAVNAVAYTVGPHVIFGAGQYAPVTFAGRRLLAHELTHTIQQGNANSAVNQIGSSADDSEHEASEAADRVGSGATHAHPHSSNDAVVRRLAEDNAADSPASTSETDNVTADDARRALISQIGEDRYRLLLQRLIGSAQPGEAGAQEPEGAVGTPSAFQAAAPVLPIVGALAAVAVCAFGFYFYALNHYRGRNDKWLHCWTSCKIAAWCGGPAPGGTAAAISALLGLGKEVLDAICDALGEPCKAEWADVLADAKGVVCGSVVGVPCSNCCDRVT